jgi:prepilin-type N-terminal cleavage/methylation domain-containing protein
MKKKGFTILELLIVVIIIGMLAGLILPVLSQAREKARRTTCINNLKQFSAAYEMYAEDYFEKFPADKEGLYNADGINRTTSIYPNYISSPKVFWCPSSISRNLPPPNGKIGEYNSTPPSDNNWEEWRNDWYASYAFVFGLSTSNKSTKPVPVISDRGIYNTRNLSNYTNLSGCNHLTGNHAWGINVLYIDGSVNWINLQEIDFASSTDGPEEEGVNVACDKYGKSISLISTTDPNLVDASGNKSKWGEE